ncbi:MAG: C1 family peptidase [Legionellaceae bacterium]|nr:C1 family peptidase [Legionellaceae bacterium]
MKFMFRVAFACFISASAFAQPDIELQGKITQVIPNSPSSFASDKTLTHTPPKTITLMGVKLSDRAWDALAKRSTEALDSPTLETTLKGPRTPSKVQLGMNQVPVMDQGQHGTCATFAVTAALDAALGAGDYISQTCHLQLGQHLETLGYNPSGWNGSLGPLVLDQIRAFGIVNKDTQKEVGCGGLTEYPAASETPEEGMTLSAFHDISEPLADEVAWTPLLDIYQIVLDRAEPQKTLDAVKTALRNNDRLTFGVLLFRLNEGVVGAVAKHHSANDTWVLTPAVIDDIKQQKNYGGHAMIITGFDDHASAVDKDGRWHKGLLTLRNSWGTDVGDGGNFYMSYDYFKVLSTEVQRIRSLKYLKD